MFTTQSNKSISEAEMDLLSYETAHDKFHLQKESENLLKKLTGVM